MAVSVDATGTALIGGSSVTTINYTGITVGASLKNGALIATLSCGLPNLISAPTAVWDSGATNQSMTLVGSAAIGVAGHEVFIAIFALRNPTSGNKTLKFSWTGSGFPSCEAISLTGVVQGSDAAAFKNFNSNTAATASALSTTITSAVGDMVIGFCGSEALSAINNTQIYLDTTSNGPDSAACRAAGASSVTVTLTPSGTGNQAVCGCDIAAAQIRGQRLKTYLRR